LARSTASVIPEIPPVGKMATCRFVFDIYAYCNSPPRARMR
jgi:hypothetical protein